MNEKTNSKPKIRLMMSEKTYNSFFTMLEFFIATEKSSGETFYSLFSKKVKANFVKYGVFIQKRHEDDSMFSIYIYESQAMKLIQLFLKYINVREKPYENFYKLHSQSKKSKNSS